MTRATVTPLEALKRLIEACKMFDFKDCPDLYNQFQTELAVAEMVVRDWKPEIDCQEFHELAMDYRAAPAFAFAPAAYKALCDYVDARIAPVAAQPADPDDMAAGYDHSTHDKRMEVLRGKRDGQTAVVAAPAGYTLVPNSPNEEMLRPDGFSYRLGYDQYQAMLAAAPAIAAPVEVERDAKRWRAFEKALRTGHLHGAAHGRRFKIIETCPMYGDEKEFNDFIGAIDAAIATGDKHE